MSDGIVSLKELIQRTNVRKESVSFRCDANILKELQQYSKKHGVSLSTLINSICTEWWYGICES